MTIYGKLSSTQRLDTIYGFLNEYVFGGCLWFWGLTGRAFATYLRTYLTHGKQPGYTCISHPFSWVISQLVTRRDW